MYSIARVLGICNNNSVNPREILGVSANANQSEIKRAFRQAAKELHPDISDSPEAAEAFAKIKHAHDVLIETADSPRESVTESRSAAHAAAATTQRPYAPQSASRTANDDEDIAHTQELDDYVRSEPSTSFFRRKKEPEEVRKHRKKLKTNERRLRGLY